MQANAPHVRRDGEDHLDFVVQGPLDLDVSKRAGGFPGERAQPSSLVISCPQSRQITPQVVSSTPARAA